MLALILTRKLRPMIIGSLSGWLMLAGDDRAAAGDLVADELRRDALGHARAEVVPGVLPRARIAGKRATSSSRSRFSRIATNSISGVTMPRRA